MIVTDSNLDIDKASLYYEAGAKSVLSDAFTSTVGATTPQFALNIHADILYAPYDSKPTWIVSFMKLMNNLVDVYLYRFYFQTSKLDKGRLTTRLGAEMVDAINLLTLVLPGAAVIQQGDELGAADAILEWKTPAEKCWPSRVAPAAAPFPWDDTVKAGFSSGEPWLPLAPNYRYANAKGQFVSDSSHSGVVRVAAAMRKSPAIGPHVEVTTKIPLISDKKRSKL